MARKRKIPARKHHGVRDPLKQNEEREKKLKNVINNPPEKGNDQKMSFKFAQFKKMADDTKAGRKMKRIHKGKEDKPKEQKKNGKTVETGNKFRKIKQFEDEADDDYMRRVNRMTSESLKEAQYEAKYGVNVIRDPKTGMITVKKKSINEIDELLKQKQKDGRKGGRANKKADPSQKPMDPKMAKALIKQAIKEDDDEKKKDNTVLEEYKHDTFRFGETVHAPPTISTLPRKAQRSETVPRPGKKNSLLLKSMLTPDNAISVQLSVTPPKAKANTAGKVTKAQMKGKRKDLPAATRSMLEKEQSRIIELYRNIKRPKENT